MKVSEYKRTTTKKADETQETSGGNFKKSIDQTHIRVKAFNYLDEKMQKEPFPLKIDHKKLSSATKMARQALSEALGATKYHRAAYDNHLDLLCASSKRDANSATQKQAITPTLIAAQQGHLEALRMLVGRGGDPEKCDSSGSACLHLAAAQNHLNCVSFLVNFGVNMWSLDNEWHTAKDVAAICQRKEVLDYLDQMMARQSAINTKQVQKFKEKATKAAEKRIKLLRKSQLKLMKQNERDERQFFKLANSRPMLKNNLPISDIRLVGKPLIKYSPSYKSDVDLNNNSIDYKISTNGDARPTADNSTKISSRSCSTSDLTGEINQDHAVKSNVNVSDCIRTFEMAFEGETRRGLDGNLIAKRNINIQSNSKQIGAPKNKTININNYKIGLFEYDSGFSGGSSVSKISSRPSPTSTTTTIATNSSNSMAPVNGTLSRNRTSSGSSATSDCKSILMGHQGKLNIARPCFSDLVAIKQDANSYQKSLAGSWSGPSNGSQASQSLIERAKKSRALSGATKLNFRKLLKVPQKLTSSTNSTSATKTTMSNSSKTSSSITQRDFKNNIKNNSKTSSVLSINCSDQLENTLNKNITYNKYHASMVDLRHEQTSAEATKQYQQLICRSRFTKTNKQLMPSFVNLNNPNNNGKSSKETCDNVPNTSQKSHKLWTTFRDDGSQKHFCDDADNYTIKWPLAPTLSKAFSQPDFGLKSISTTQDEQETGDTCKGSDDQVTSLTDQRDQQQQDLINDDHLICVQDVNDDDNFLKEHLSNLRQPRKLGDDDQQLVHANNGQLFQSSPEARDANNQINHKQHHLMLNECLSQLKLHRKQQQQQQKDPNHVNQKQHQVKSRANICTSSTELLQHQLQAGELPLKPSLIKQHQLAVSKALCFPSQHNRSKGLKAGNFIAADSIGSATSLAQRTNGGSSSVASTSANSSARSISSAAWSSPSSSSKNSDPLDRCKLINEEIVERKSISVNYSCHELKLPTIELFLKQNGLNEDLSDIFAREMIDFEALLLLSDIDLKSINILLGPRKKLLKAIEKFKQTLLKERPQAKGTTPRHSSRAPNGAPPTPPPMPAFSRGPLVGFSMVDTKL